MVLNVSSIKIPTMNLCCHGSWLWSVCTSFIFGLPMQCVIPPTSTGVHACAHWDRKEGWERENEAKAALPQAVYVGWPHHFQQNHNHQPMSDMRLNILFRKHVFLLPNDRENCQCVSIEMTVKVQISIFLSIWLKIQLRGLIHISQGYKNLTANAECSDQLYNKKTNNNRDRHAEPSQLAWSTTAEPTRSVSASHSSEDTSFHRTLYPTGDRNGLPPPRCKAQHWTTRSTLRPAWIRKINANTATGREEEKTVAKRTPQPELVMGVIMHYRG